MCYDELRLRYTEGPFFEAVLKPDKTSVLCNFLRRSMDRIGYVVRQHSIGQTIPQDWKDQAITSSMEIRKRFQENNVDVILNADQTFVKFLHDDRFKLAPKGSK